MRGQTGLAPLFSPDVRTFFRRQMRGQTGLAPLFSPDVRTFFRSLERCHPAHAISLFHSPLVTSDLALKIKLRNDDRGSNGRVSPNRRAPKLLVLKNLVSKFFDIKVLPGNSR